VVRGLTAIWARRDDAAQYPAKASWDTNLHELSHVKKAVIASTRPGTPRIAMLRERPVVSKLRGGRQYQSVTAAAPTGASGNKGHTNVRKCPFADLTADSCNKICQERKS
jgi:hypothetical protein